MTPTTHSREPLRLADMTWGEVRELAPPWIAVLPIGAIEAHGPHLPLATDCIIAEAMAEAGAGRLARSRASVVLLPTLSYTPAPFAAGFAGTVSVPADAVREVVESVAEAVADAGAAAMAIANAHLDPAHVACLRNATATIVAAGRISVAFPDVTRRRLADRLTEEFRSGACHAGRYEGSIVMAARPDLVRASIAGSLPPNPASLVDAIEEGHTTFEAAGGPRAYFGWPSDASAEEGRRTIEILGDMLAEAIDEALT
ncbi:MAG TPA: creatininase family protein [Longimicrobiales bacterium]|nr:creatininase family protein [Longimicrobiales bacterium]